MYVVSDSESETSRKILLAEYDLFKVLEMLLSLEFCSLARRFSMKSDFRKIMKFFDCIHENEEQIKFGRPCRELTHPDGCIRSQWQGGFIKI